MIGVEFIVLPRESKTEYTELMRLQSGRDKINWETVHMLRLAKKDTW